MTVYSSTTTVLNRTMVEGDSGAWWKYNGNRFYAVGKTIPIFERYLHFMYSRQEASQLRQQFWTAFGQYMLPIPSADGEKVNWVNYKTGIKDIHFRMNADTQQATITIEITGPLQELYFEQFQHLQPLLRDALGEDWDWQLHQTDEAGNTISSISTRLKDVSIFRREDWPQLISFFKTRIIALDEFWSNARYTFEAL